jgi:hypothetical protein
MFLTKLSSEEQSALLHCYLAHNQICYQVHKHFRVNLPLQSKFSREKETFLAKQITKILQCYGKVEVPFG